MVAALKVLWSMKRAHSSSTPPARVSQYTMRGA